MTRRIEGEKAAETEIQVMWKERGQTIIERAIGIRGKEQRNSIYFWFRYLMFIVRKTQAKMMPQTAKIEITTNNVNDTLEGRILLNVRSTGGEFPPEKNRQISCRCVVVCNSLQWTVLRWWFKIEPSDNMNSPHTTCVCALSSHH